MTTTFFPFPADKPAFDTAARAITPADIAQLEALNQLYRPGPLTVIPTWSAVEAPRPPRHLAYLLGVVRLRLMIARLALSDAWAVFVAKVWNRRG